MKHQWRWLCILLLGFSTNVSAWEGADLGELSLRFARSIPADMTAERQGWLFFTLQTCFKSGASNCWGANPDSPYGIPQFLDSAGGPTRLRKDEAIVFIVRTPPSLRYFSLIPYLHTRTKDGEQKTLFASLDEPLNNLKIITSGSVNPGEQVWDQLTVAVMTADLRIFYRIKGIFNSLGFPHTAVQLLHMPRKLLKLRQDPLNDSFTLLMRVALADDPAQFDTYITGPAPVHVYRLTPNEEQNTWPVPKPDLTPPGSGAEDPDGDLQQAMDQLVADIVAHYPDANLAPNPVVSWSPVGFDCIEAFQTCGGDNYDALYTRDAARLENNPDSTDFTLIVGVNHHLLDRALYINHAISDPDRHAGVAAFSDKDLAGSAAYHAGITRPDDPRHQAYQNLYAYAVAVNCNGMEYCLEVPQIINQGDIGIEAGAFYDIVGRVYVDPATTVRPLDTDLVLHKVLMPGQQGL